MIGVSLIFKTSVRTGVQKGAVSDGRSGIENSKFLLHKKSFYHDKEIGGKIRKNNVSVDKTSQLCFKVFPFRSKVKFLSTM